MSIRELYNPNQNDLYCHDLTLSGDLNMNGDLLLDDVHVTGTTDSSSVTTGALIVDGGAGIAKKLHVGDTLTLHNITDTSKYTDLSTNTSGELLIYSSGGVINMTNTTQATSTSTGALIIGGGVGIAGNLYVGGTMGYPTYLQSINIDTDGVYGGSSSYMVTLSLTKVGTIVQMNLTGTGLHQSLFPTVFKSIVGAIPTLYLPSADVYGFCQVRANNVSINTVGEVHITSTGQIIVSASLTGGNQVFDAGYDAGYVAFSLSWLQ